METARKSSKVPPAIAKSTRSAKKTQENEQNLKLRLRNSNSREIQQGPLKKAPSIGLYNNNGRVRGTREDICDCMEEDCIGCHYECKKCKSTKCGSICRVNRKFAFDTIEIDGSLRIVKNNKFSKN